MCSKFLKAHTNHFVEDLGLGIRDGKKARVETVKFKKLK